MTLLAIEVTSLKVAVTSTKLEHSDFGTHIVYTVRITHPSGSSWEVCRRYAEFDALWKVLRRELHGLQFPRRMHNASNAQVEKRKQQLHNFLRAATARRALRPLSDQAAQAISAFVQLREHLPEANEVNEISSVLVKIYAD